MIKKPVLRMCIISREKLEKNELFRIVKTKDNKIIIDSKDSKIYGRGAYLKKDKDIINKAKKNKQLERHLQIKIDDNLYDELLNDLD